MNVNMSTTRRTSETAPIIKKGLQVISEQEEFNYRMKEPLIEIEEVDDVFSPGPKKINKVFLNFT